MELHQPSLDLFSHTRIVIGMVIGLGITRTLLTFANIIQTPATHKRSLLHVLWLSAMLLELALFWYAHIEMVLIPRWNFGLFAFFFAYAIVVYMQIAMLTSDKAPEYGGYEEFFIERRHWFFSFFAFAHLFDIVDTYLLMPEPETDVFDFATLSIFLILSAVGWIVRNKKAHYVIVSFHLATLAFVSVLFALDSI